MSDKKFMLETLYLRKSTFDEGYRVTVKYSNKGDAIEITLPDDLSDRVLAQVSEYLIKTSKIAANTMAASIADQAEKLKDPQRNIAPRNES